MFYAVAADGLIVAVTMSKESALDVMSALANLPLNRPKQVMRFETDSRAYLAFSHGKALKLGWMVRDGRSVPIVRAVKRGR